jgi:hypothetical protein
LIFDIILDCVMRQSLEHWKESVIAIPMCCHG